MTRSCPVALLALVASALSSVALVACGSYGASGGRSADGASAPQPGTSDDTNTGGSTTTSPSGTTGGFAEILITTVPWRTKGVHVDVVLRTTKEATSQSLDCAPRRTVGACWREDCKPSLPAPTTASDLSLGTLTAIAGEDGGAPMELSPHGDLPAVFWNGGDVLHLTASGKDVPPFAVDLRAPSRVSGWRRELGTDPVIRDGQVVFPPLDRQAGMPSSWFYQGEPWGTVETRLSAQLPDVYASVSCFSAVSAKESAFPPELLDGIPNGTAMLLVHSEATTRTVAANGEPFEVHVMLEEYLADARFTLK